MTIICAYTDGTDTWTGSDKLLVQGSNRVLLPQGKWTVAQGWGIAFAGATRYRVVVEEHADELFSHIAKYALAEFSLSLGALFRRFGMTPEHDAEDGVERWGVSAMLATRGHIWDMDRTLTCIEAPSGKLVANGHGWEFAEGAAWALQQRVVPAPGGEYLVKRAVECACALDRGDCEGLWHGKL